MKTGGKANSEMPDDAIWTHMVIEWDFYEDNWRDLPKTEMTGEFLSTAYVTADATATK
jgi:hypothetical protein